MKKLAQVGVLCSMLNCKPEDLIRHRKTVYQWRSIYYEVVGSKSKTAPASHYTTISWGGKAWSVRELGDKSEIMKGLEEDTLNDNQK